MRYLLLSLLLALLLPLARAEDEGACNDLFLTPQQLELEQQVKAAAIQVDLKQLSQSVTGAGILQAYTGFTDEAAEAAIREGNEIFFRLLYQDQRREIDFIWLVGAYPHEFVRRAFLSEMLEDPLRNGQSWKPKFKPGWVASQFNRYSEVKNAKGVRAWLRQPVKPGGEALQRQKKTFETKIANAVPVQGQQIEALGLKLHAFCALYSLWSAHECAQAAQFILERMRPVEYLLDHGKSPDQEKMLEVSRADLIGEVLFQDPRYAQASKQLAAKLVDWVDSESMPPMDFVTAVQRTFEGIAASPEEATDMTWKFLGVYSALGASIGENLYQLAPAAGDFAFSAQIWASAVQVLDARMHGSGRLFSIPWEFETDLETAKPYHLMMEIVLMREMHRAGFSIDSATIAAWIAQLGYQMASETMGRDPTRAFRQPRVSTANLKIRFDLVNAAAGIRYGQMLIEGTLNPGDRLSINQAFRLSLAESQESPLLSQAEADKLFDEDPLNTYLTWAEIFQPKLILRYFTTEREEPVPADGATEKPAAPAPIAAAKKIASEKLSQALQNVAESGLEEALQTAKAKAEELKNEAAEKISEAKKAATKAASRFFKLFDRND